MIQVDMTKRPQIMDLLRLPQSSSRLATLPTYSEVQHKLPSNITVQVAAAVAAAKQPAAPVAAPVAKPAPVAANVTREAAPTKPSAPAHDDKLSQRKAELDQREAQVRLREKAVEKREAECIRREQAINARPTVPAFNADKENATVVNEKKHADDNAPAKPLQPLQNIYDRREKLLARLLNHRIGNE